MLLHQVERQGGKACENGPASKLCWARIGICNTSSPTQFHAPQKQEWTVLRTKLQEKRDRSAPMVERHIQERHIQEHNPGSGRGLAAKCPTSVHFEHDNTCLFDLSDHRFLSFSTCHTPPKLCLTPDFFCRSVPLRACVRVCMRTLHASSL